MFESRYIYCDSVRVPSVLTQIADLGLGVEILFESTEDIWPQLRWENLLELADLAAETGVPVSVHGPFDGLNLGSRDSHIRSYTLEALAASLEAARAFHSPHVVFHTGFLLQYPPKNAARWLDQFSRGLDDLLIYARETDVRLLMENTYEPDPSLFEEIFERFATPSLGMCLDTGHAACFGRVEPETWARRFLDRICHVHCSDNDGRDDLHLGLGQGIVNFRSILEPLGRFGNDVSVTLEVSAEDAVASRDYLNELIQAITAQDVS